MIIKIPVGIAILIVIFLIVVVTRPADFKVSRSASIAAHAVRATFAAKLGQKKEAIGHFRKAEALATLPSKKDFLALRIHKCGS